MSCRALILATVLVLPLALPVVAQEAPHAHDEHEASAGALTLVHAWTRAAGAGEDSMVFFEIENAGAAVQLTSASTDVASRGELVGATMSAEAALAYLPVGAVIIAPGDFALEPTGLGLRLVGLTEDLVQGDEFELEVAFSDGTEVHLHVEIEAADATQHSHAGHSH